MKTGNPKASYYLATKAREEGEAIAITNHNRAKQAALAARRLIITDPNPSLPPLSLEAGDSHHRKHAINYQYKYVYNSAPFDDVNSPIINNIMVDLNIPRGSRNSVKNILEDYCREGP